MGKLILAGGRDMVIGRIAGAVWRLAGVADERARLAANPSLIPAAVEELLRFLRPCWTWTPMRPRWPGPRTTARAARSPSSGPSRVSARSRLIDRGRPTRPGPAYPPCEP